MSFEVSKEPSHGRVTELGGPPPRADESRARWGKLRRQDPSSFGNSGPVRGYLKLSSAAKAFNFDFHDKIVLDIGSSTGGFTKYALDHGAKKVIAIEKGTNQMMKPLRFDPRIDLHEKMDVFGLGVQKETFEGIPERGSARFSARAPWRRARATRPEKVLFCTPDVIMADVSFVSLTKVLKHAKNHLSDSHTEFLVMLKPQFEALQSELRDGVVKNNTIRRQIIKRFELWLKNNGFIIINKHDNLLKGKNGNQERFYLLTLQKHKHII